MFNSYYEVKIEGKDIKRFIKMLHHRKIELLSINYDLDSILVKLDQNNYKKLLELKTMYELKLTRLYGLAKYKYLIKNYLPFLCCLLIGFLTLFLLSNIILDVEVVHRKEEIRSLINKELKRYHLEKYNLVVPFAKKEEIVKNILDNNKDRLEWLEIERKGTKYIVKVEERIINEPKQESGPRHVVAGKDGIIKHIDASSGEIVKAINDYVKKGDIIISGNISKGDEIKNVVTASGNVYAEVWYEVKATMPLVYKEEYLTGRTKKTLTLTFLNHNFSLFDFFPYPNKRIQEHIIMQNNLLPIKLSFNLEEEMHVIDEVYTYEEAIDKALDLAREKIKVKLDKNEEILFEKKLKTIQNNSTIELTVFFKVYENITSYQSIEEDNSIEE